MVTGPRASGKATTAAHYAKTIISLDQPNVAAAFRADPDVQIARLVEPVLFDEWQAVPEVMGAIKRSVDRDYRPGRFLLTGSVRAAVDPNAWPATGRIASMHLGPMTERELAGCPVGSVFDRIRADEISNPTESVNLEQYVMRACRGGFPQAALADDLATSNLILDGYTQQLLVNDARADSSRRDSQRLRQFVTAMASNSSGIYENKFLNETAKINNVTAQSYESLFIDLGIVERVGAWSTNQVERITSMPKRLIADSGLMSRLLHVQPSDVLLDSTMLGRVIETFGLNQLLAELHATDRRDHAFHLRTEKGRQEIDLVVETDDQRIIAIEVKAQSAPSRDSAKHLIWLQQRLGDKFEVGVVFHTGPLSYQLADKIWAHPISTIWS
jgi:predicted AAA+ superfamily ATPase